MPEKLSNFSRQCRREIEFRNGDCRWRSSGQPSSLRSESMSLSIHTSLKPITNNSGATLCGQALLYLLDKTISPNVAKMRENYCRILNTVNTLLEIIALYYVPY